MAVNPFLGLGYVSPSLAPTSGGRTTPQPAGAGAGPAPGAKFNGNYWYVPPTPQTRPQTTPAATPAPQPRVQQQNQQAVQQPMPQYQPQMPMPQMQQQNYQPLPTTMPQMPAMQPQQPMSPNLTTSIQRRQIMDQAPLLAAANQQAQQYAANNASGNPAINQQLADNLQHQMLNMGVDFDRMAGAANQKHGLSTQITAANDIIAKGGLAQEQQAQQFRNEAMQRNIMNYLLGIG